MNINDFHNIKRPLIINKPWSSREFIRLATYIAHQHGVKLGNLKLAKAEAILTLEKGFPRASVVSLYHHGPFNPLFEKYIRLEISEGYLRKTPSGLELTRQGEDYVKTVLLPSESDDYCKRLAELLLMPESELITKAYDAAGFKVDRIKGKLVYRLVKLEDFMSGEALEKNSQKILFNTLLCKVLELKRFLYRKISYLPEVNVKNLPECVKINQNLRKLCVKTRIPAAKALQLVELKNAVLNRFVYVLAVYLINVIEKRYANFNEIYYITHDWALEYLKKKRFKKYLSENNIQNLERRKVQVTTHKVVKNDLNVLTTAGLLRKDERSDSFAVTALSFTDGEATLYLPSAQFVRERYELLRDELNILGMEFRVNVRGFDCEVKTLKYEVDSEFSNIITVDYPEKNFQLTRLRSQGIVMDRLELLQIIYRVYRKIFAAIKKFYKLDEFRGSIRIQVILVMRDAISAWHSAVEEFPETPIGMIGHVRRTEGDKVTEVEISFDRCEDPNKFDLVIVVDPMVATGSTTLKVINYLKSKCAGKTEPLFILAAILVSPEAARKLSPLRIFCLSLEKSLEGVWLNPGLRGLKDLGDLIFKTSLDWEPVAEKPMEDRMLEVKVDLNREIDDFGSKLLGDG